MSFFPRIFVLSALLLVCGSQTVSAWLQRVPSLTPSIVPNTIQTWTGNTTKKIKKAQKIENTPAPEYAMIYKWKSIDIYEDAKNHVFVQKIQLWSGAKLSAFFDFHSFDSMTGEPLYSKFSPREKISKLSDPPLSFINGQFFDPRRKNTPLSFAFKYRDTILTAGADNRDEQKNIFSYSSASGARIIPYTWSALQSETSNFALVNLSIHEAHESDAYIGRTYLCILAPRWDGYSDTIMTFVFQAATEWYATSVVRSWGCRDEYVSKLDASGSAVYGFRDVVSYGFARKWSPDYRKIPQIIGFYEN